MLKHVETTSQWLVFYLISGNVSSNSFMMASLHPRPPNPFQKVLTNGICLYFYLRVKVAIVICGHFFVLLAAKDAAEVSHQTFAAQASHLKTAHCFDSTAQLTRMAS